MFKREFEKRLEKQSKKKSKRQFKTTIAPLMFLAYAGLSFNSFANAPDTGQHQVSAVHSAVTSTVKGAVAAQLSESLTFATLPLQLTVDQGSSKTFVFDSAVTSVASRKGNVASWAVNGQSLTVSGLEAGRTGLKIQAASGAYYYIGLRVNHADGAMPGLPKYLSMGSVSEDSEPDLDFWRDIDIDMTNKNMDVRYIYINGGPMERGWQSWGGKRAERFTAESLRLGLIPFFVYYNIPDGGESFTTNLSHIRDTDYMQDYFQDLDIFMAQVQTAAQGELYGMILEPDFLGYFQQMGDLHLGTSDPAQISTVVGADQIDNNAGTIKTLIERVNKTINDKRREGHQVFFGWQLNLWSYAPTSGSKGVLRRTDSDDLGWVAGRQAIDEAAQATAQYGIDAGILSHGADFVSIDKYGLDAMIHQNTPNPADSTWFFNNDHWMNYLHYVKQMHQVTNKPMVLWQLPVGHINGSTDTSAYTGQAFPLLDNSNTRGEDSTTSFFFGDTINTNDSVRQQYFSQNLAGDSKLSASGNQITFGDHFSEAKDAGVIMALFGAGVGMSTDGVGSPPTDDHFWIQKVQGYYANGVVPLSQEYGTGGYVCPDQCAPWVEFVSPASGDEIRQASLSPVTITFNATDEDGTVASVALSVGQTPLATTVQGGVYTAQWLPSAYGSHTINVTAVDNEGLTVDAQTSVSVLTPDACTLPEWSAATIYNSGGNQVHYQGFSYENRWYATGESNRPDLPGDWGPWVKLGVCQRM